MTQSKRPDWIGELARGAEQLLTDVTVRFTETARWANDHEQVQHWKAKASEAAQAIEERTRELEPVVRERASQAAVDLQRASKAASRWLRQKPDEGVQSAQQPENSPDPERPLDPTNRSDNS